VRRANEGAENRRWRRADPQDFLLTDGHLNAGITEAAAIRIDFLLWNTPSVWSF
jgi:hypothetical protein